MHHKNACVQKRRSMEIHKESMDLTEFDANSNISHVRPVIRDLSEKTTRYWVINIGGQSVIMGAVRNQRKCVVKIFKFCEDGSLCSCEDLAENEYMIANECDHMYLLGPAEDLGMVYYRVHDMQEEPYIGYAIAYPYLDGHDLGDEIDLKINFKEEMPEDKVRYWMHCSLQALSVLHSHGIVHNDVKPENIMLTLDGKVHLIDYGCAFHVREMAVNGTTGNILSQSCGTHEYMAYDMTSASTYSRDVWALGVVLWTMLTKQEYKGENLKIASSFCSYFSEDIYEVLSAMLCAEPQRKSVDDILKMKWFQASDTNGNIGSLMRIE